MIPAHARELIQEFLEGIAGLDVVEKVLNRYSRPPEHWSSMHDLRIAMDHGRLIRYLISHDQILRL